MFRFSVAAASAALFLTATQAIAGTVVIQQTVDLSAAEDRGFGGLELGAAAFSPVSTQVAEGDTLDWTIRFNAGQSLVPTDPQFLFIGLIPEIGQFNYLTQIDPARLQLLGANDEVLADYTVVFNGISASNIIGLFGKGIPVSGDPLFGPGTPTFSGVRMVLNVGTYEVIDQNVLTFNSAFMNFGGFEPQTAAVPEPATWGLLIAGFGFAGAMLRRRRVFAAA